MSLKACIIAGVIVSSAALAQESTPLDDRKLGQTKPVLEPGQTPVKPFWPGDGDGGLTIVSFDVKKGGHPTNCRVVTSSGIKRYDKMACDIILHRTRYSPGFSGYGFKPRSGVSQTIKWASLYDNLSAPADVANCGLTAPAIGAAPQQLTILSC